MKMRKIGWGGSAKDLYSAALILTEKPARIVIDIRIEPLKPWQPVKRVSEKVVRRREVR